MKLNIIDLSYVKQYRPRRNTISVKLNIGFDTETINGKCVLITCSDGRFRIIHKFEDILEFLTYRDYSTSLNWFYNLRYDYTGILKYLDFKKLKQLYETNTLLLKDYEISYIPRKIFSIYNIREKRTYNYFDLAQMYSMSLKKACWTYNNQYHQKMDVNSIIDDYIEINREYILYCMNDALITKVLADKFVRFCNSFDMIVKKPYSKASISQRYFYNNCYIPSINSFIDSDHDQALGYATASYKGGRFEVSDRGYFEQLYVYDLNSAYPYEMSNLIDFTQGKWYKNTKYQPEAWYGYIRCNIEITNKSNWGCIPFMFRNVNYFPEGQIKNVYITKNEYEFITENELGKIRILDGWYFDLYDLLYPLKNVIKYLYSERQKLKNNNDDREFIIKIILNSMYGKFISVVDDKIDTDKQKTTNLFSPIWATEITANTRLKLLEQLINNDSIIAVATDSLISTEKLNINNSVELGEWKNEADGDGIILGSGIYSINAKKTINKFRGFDTKIDIIELLSNNKDKTHIKIEKPRPITIGEIICFSDTFPFETLNQFCTIEKELDINFDRKRNWDDSFSNAEDVLNHNIQSTRKICIDNRIYDTYQDYEDREYAKMIRHSPERVRNPRLRDWLKDHEQEKDIIDDFALFDTDIGDNWNTVRFKDFISKVTNYDEL